MGPGITSSLCSEIVSDKQLGVLPCRYPAHLCGAYGESRQRFFCHPRYVLTCLNSTIVLLNAIPGLASVGNVRSKGAIVRDSKTVITRILN